MRAVAAAILCAVVAGCGGGGASTRRPAATAQATAATARATAATARVTAATAGATPAPASQDVRIAQRTHEYPQPPAVQHVLVGWHTPVEALHAYAYLYTNWTAQTVSGRMRALALLSIGQARALARLQAAQTAGDDELRRGGIANSATVETIAPQDAGGGGRWIVVTLERTTSSRTDAYRGLAPAWHVSLGSVTRVAGGLWVVSGWQPES